MRRKYVFNKNEGLEELKRERDELARLDLRNTNSYRQAMKLYEEAKRNASRGETVTGWSGLWTH